MLNIEDGDICCPYYLEVNKDNLMEFLEFQKELHIENITFIYKNSMDEVNKAKQLFSTKDYKISVKEMISDVLKENLIKLIEYKIDVNLSIIYKNYKGKNLQVIY